MPAAIVRIWEPSGMLETGHVSLETTTSYVSFWPDHPAYDNPQHLRRIRGKGEIETKASAEKKLFVKRIPGQGCLMTPEYDECYTEYKKDPIIYMLHTLDTDIIDKQFEEFKSNDNFKWHQFNGLFSKLRKLFYWTRSQEMNVKSCSGLVSCLLYTGGIEKLLPIRTRLMKGAVAGALGGFFAAGMIKTIKHYQSDGIELDTKTLMSRRGQSIDRDSTVAVGLWGTSLSAGFLVVAWSSVWDSQSWNSSECLYKGVIGGAVVGLACGFLKITDSGPPLPARDIGKMVEAAERKEQRLLREQDCDRKCSFAP